MEAPRPRSSILSEVAVAALVLAAALVSTLWLRALPGGTLASLLVALIPVPVFAFAFVVIVRKVRRCDELAQRMQFEALAFAFPVGMLLLQVLDAIQRAGYSGGFDLNDGFIGLGLLYLLGLVLARRRYR